MSVGTIFPTICLFIHVLKAKAKIMTDAFSIWEMFYVLFCVPIKGPSVVARGSIRDVCLDGRPSFICRDSCQTEPRPPARAFIITGLKTSFLTVSGSFYILSRHGIDPLLLHFTFCLIIKCVFPLLPHLAPPMIHTEQEAVKIVVVVSD